MMAKWPLPEKDNRKKVLRKKRLIVQVRKGGDIFLALEQTDIKVSQNRSLIFFCTHILLWISFSSNESGPQSQNPPPGVIWKNVAVSGGQSNKG